jgi:hypothetical protein
MDIFIDESGTFTPRPDGSSIAAVGALVVTESQVPIFERRYGQVRPLLPKAGGEVKGRLLDEADVARVVDIARRSGLIYEVTVIDLLPDHAAAVEAHRAEQCEGLTRRLTEKHKPSLVAGVRALRARLERMPLQLYAQYVGTADLLWRTLQHATLYYCQREPHSLARFRWVIDAKAPDGPTDWEDWWSHVVRPMLQARSLREPFGQLEGGDYSHLAAQEMPVPDYLVKEFPRLKGKTGLSLSEAFREIVFSADSLPGLEVVDVLTNAVRRALTGHLGERGWQGIGGVMIHRRGPTCIHPVGFGQDKRVIPSPAAEVLRHLGKGGRSMLTRSTRRHLE